MPWVSEQDYNTATKRWYDHWPCHETCSWFDFAFGGTDNRNVFHNGTHWKVSEEAARKIEPLAGPHYLTVLKMAEIRHREALNKKYLKK